MRGKQQVGGQQRNTAACACIDASARSARAPNQTLPARAAPTSRQHERTATRQEGCSAHPITTLTSEQQLLLRIGALLVHRRQCWQLGQLQLQWAASVEQGKARNEAAMRVAGGRTAAGGGAVGEPAAAPRSP